MGTDRDTQPIGVFSALLGAAIACAIYGAVIMLGWYALWYWVIRPDLAGKQWAWLIQPPGPFDNHWLDMWIWATGLLFVLNLPKAVLISVRSRRQARRAD